MRKMILTATALAAALSGTAAIAQRGPQEPVNRDAYLAQMKDRFTRMDANADGVVTKDELRAQMTERMGNAPPPQMVEAMFARIDTDGDGKASVAEAEAAEIARFATLDTDHDGILTPDERRAGMPHRPQ